MSGGRDNVNALAPRGRAEAPRRRRPIAVFDDRAYDSTAHRKDLRRHRILSLIARRNHGHGGGLGRFLWPPKEPSHGCIDFAAFVSATIAGTKSRRTPVIGPRNGVLEGPHRIVMLGTLNTSISNYITTESVARFTTHGPHGLIASETDLVKCRSTSRS